VSRLSSKHGWKSAWDFGVWTSVPPLPNLTAIPGGAVRSRAERVLYSGRSKVARKMARVVEAWMGRGHSFKSPAIPAAIARYSLLRQGAAIRVHV
jgi:hypothetical protein